MTARSLGPASKRALRSAPNGTGAPPLLLILRGPLGVGKSTVARALARTLGAHVVSIDRLVDPVWDGGSLRLFLRANVAAAATARRSASKRTDVIVDGCFYWKGQLKDLERRSPLPTRTFTLVAPLATCIARDAGRSTSFGPEAAEAVYRKVMRFRWGAEIDARRPVREIVARIRSDCRETRAAFRDAARPGDRRSAGRASGNDRRGPPVLAS